MLIAQCIWVINRQDLYKLNKRSIVGLARPNPNLFEVY